MSEKSPKNGMTKTSQKERWSACILRCFFIGVLIKRPGFLLMAETALWERRDAAMVPKGKRQYLVSTFLGIH